MEAHLQSIVSSSQPHSRKLQRGQPPPLVHDAALLPLLMFPFRCRAWLPLSSAASPTDNASPVARCRRKSAFTSHTTTEQAFVPGHLSRQPLGPGQYVAFVSGPMASRASGGDRGLLSRLEAPTETKGETFVPVGGSNRDKRLRVPFVPVGVSNRDKRPLSPPLAWLAVGPGTKATYCPEPKSSQDKMA